MVNGLTSGSLTRRLGREKFGRESLRRNEEEGISLCDRSFERREVCSVFWLLSLSSSMEEVVESIEGR